MFGVIWCLWQVTSRRARRRRLTVSPSEGACKPRRTRRTRNPMALALLARRLACVTGGVLSGALVLSTPAFAAAPNIIGQYTVNDVCTSSACSGAMYSHGFDISSEAPSTGSFSGTESGGNGGTVTGTIIKGNSGGWYTYMTITEPGGYRWGPQGTIASDCSMSGTYTDSNGQSGTWQAKPVSGHCGSPSFVVTPRAPLVGQIGTPLSDQEWHIGTVSESTGANFIPSQLAVSVDWGDGQVSTPSDGTVHGVESNYPVSNVELYYSGLHVYRRPGPYTVTITVRQVSGSGAGESGQGQTTAVLSVAAADSTVSTGHYPIDIHPESWPNGSSTYGATLLGQVNGCIRANFDFEGQSPPTYDFRYARWDQPESWFTAGNNHGETYLTTYAQTPDHDHPLWCPKVPGGQAVSVRGDFFQADTAYAYYLEALTPSSCPPFSNDCIFQTFRGDNWALQTGPAVVPQRDKHDAWVKAALAMDVAGASCGAAETIILIPLCGVEAGLAGADVKAALDPAAGGYGTLFKPPKVSVPSLVTLQRGCRHLAQPACVRVARAIRLYLLDGGRLQAVQEAIAVTGNRFTGALRAGAHRAQGRQRAWALRLLRTERQLALKFRNTATRLARAIRGTPLDHTLSRTAIMRSLHRLETGHGIPTEAYRRLHDAGLVGSRKQLGGLLGFVTPRTTPRQTRLSSLLLRVARS